MMRHAHILLLTFVAISLLGCGTTSAYKGDPEARELEKLVEELNEALIANDVEEATSVANSIDRFVRENRRELELHPEASMLFSRIDSGKRRLRKKQKVAKEVAAANAITNAEESVQLPLAKASEVAQKLLDGDAKTSDVIELRRAIDQAQDALNGARRAGTIKVGGDFANQMESRLTILRETAEKTERLAKLNDARDHFTEGLTAIELAESRSTPGERLGDYDSARNKFTSSQEGINKLLEEDPNLIKHKLKVDEGKKPIRVKELLRRIAKQLKGLEKLVAKTQKEKEQLDSLSQFTSDKSGDQKALVEKWQRKPDVMSKKKGKTVWTYIEKKKIKKRGRKRTVKTYNEYTFDESGVLVDENKRKR